MDDGRDARTPRTAAGGVRDVERDAERALLGWAIHLSDYAPGASLPEVRYVSRAFLAGRACPGRDRCRVLGWYDDRNVVYVAEELRALDSLFARSLLVHEFVHYLQHRSGRFPRHACADFVAREREAYAVQQAFFVAYGAVPQIRARHYACDEFADARLTSREKRRARPDVERDGSRVEPVRPL